MSMSAYTRFRSRDSSWVASCGNDRDAEHSMEVYLQFDTEGNRGATNGLSCPIKIIPSHDITALHEIGRHI